MAILLIVSFLAFSCNESSVGRASRPSSNQKTRVVVHQVGEIESLIETLRPTTTREIWSFPSAEVREGTFQRLIRIAQESPEARRLVITTLLKTFRDDSSDRRIYIAHVLSRLKAVEALRPIVQHLDERGFFSYVSLTIRPMVSAVVGFGEVAVPYLAEALTDSRISIRMEACIALGFIGGEKARQVLETALESERDNNVIESIRGGLADIELTRLQKERSKRQ